MYYNGEEHGIFYSEIIWLDEMRIKIKPAYSNPDMNLHVMRMNTISKDNNGFATNLINQYTPHLIHCADTDVGW